LDSDNAKRCFCLLTGVREDGMRCGGKRMRGNKRCINRSMIGERRTWNACGVPELCINAGERCDTKDAYTSLHFVLGRIRRHCIPRLFALRHDVIEFRKHLRVRIFFGEKVLWETRITGDVEVGLVRRGPCSVVVRRNRTCGSLGELRAGELRCVHEGVGAEVKAGLR
jgi:hypothetical protein